MNATAIPAHKNASMRRIRILSQILKALVLIYLVVIPLLSVASPKLVNSIGNYACLPGQTFHQISTPRAVSPGTKIVTVLTAAIHLLGAIGFYRLLNLYEKGVVFSPANVRLFRWLGLLAICKGLLGVAAMEVAFVEFDFAMAMVETLSSSWVIGGFFVITLSYIVDEGYKLKEEQELTV
jgi:hypothetical protein